MLLVVPCGAHVHIWGKGPTIVIWRTRRLKFRPWGVIPGTSEVMLPRVQIFPKSREKQYWEDYTSAGFVAAPSPRSQLATPLYTSESSSQRSVSSVHFDTASAKFGFCQHNLLNFWEIFSSTRKEILGTFLNITTVWVMHVQSLSGLTEEKQKYCYINFSMECTRN